MYKFSNIDLHVHSYYSDGLLSPEEIINEAEKSNLSAISLSDHDTVRGIDETICAGINKGIIVIPGIELSSYDEETDEEIHVLGYYFDYKNKEFLDKIKRFEFTRDTRADKIIFKLEKLGISIKKKNLTAKKNSVYGRLHIAREMVRSGQVKDIREAFNKYLAAGAPAFVKKERITPEEAISIINKAGGIASLAHPKFGGGKKKIIKRLSLAGLKGLEVYYLRHNMGDVKRYLNYAKEFDLVVTGGSDCHGQRINNKLLLGSATVPYDILLRLKEIHRNLIPT